MLSRPQLAARIKVLRDALDLLAAQAEWDQHGVFGCVGAMKVHLIWLEHELGQIDRAHTLGAQLEAELKKFARTA